MSGTSMVEPSASLKDSSLVRDDWNGSSHEAFRYTAFTRARTGIPPEGMPCWRCEGSVHRDRCRPHSCPGTRLSSASSRAFIEAWKAALSSKCSTFRNCACTSSVVPSPAPGSSIANAIAMLAGESVRFSSKLSARAAANMSSPNAVIASPASRGSAVGSDLSDESMGSPAASTVVGPDPHAVATKAPTNTTTHDRFQKRLMWVLRPPTPRCSRISAVLCSTVGRVGRGARRRGRLQSVSAWLRFPERRPSRSTVT